MLPAAVDPLAKLKISFLQKTDFGQKMAFGMMIDEWMVFDTSYICLLFSGLRQWLLILYKLAFGIIMVCRLGSTVA